MERSQGRGNFLQLSLRLLPAVLAMLLLACVARHGGMPPSAPDMAAGGEAGTGAQRATPVTASLPRPSPSYVQWLERQSLRVQAGEYTSLLTASPLQWRAASVDNAPAGRTPGRVRDLLAAADIWLLVNPHDLLLPPRASVWHTLREALPSLATLGIRGMHAGPTAEPASVWHTHAHPPDGADTTDAPDAAQAPVSLQPAHYMGTDEEFAAFAAQAEQAQWQLGADILPPATGLGPDFMLAAQDVRDYPGLYMMVEAPRTLWHHLPPPASSPWQGRPLDARAVALLAGEGLVPPALARDALPLPCPGGWAITGPVRGHNGESRRLVYRYDQSPADALLHWDSPTGSARALLMASVINEVGVRRQTLAGLHLAPALGLDATTENAAHPPTGALPTLEPAPSLLRDLSREARRCGGWSVQWDALPPALLPLQQQAGVDFCQDSLTAPLTLYALLTGDAHPLRQALRGMLAAGVDYSRLARSSPGNTPLPLYTAPLATSAEMQRRLLAKATELGWAHAGDATGLRGSTAAWAATSLGLSPQAATQPQHGEAIAVRHLLVLRVLAGLPGLVALHGQDVRGTLAPGAFALTPGATDIASRSGQAAAPTLYPCPGTAREHAFFHGLTRIAQARRSLQLAQWRVREVPDAPANALVVTLQHPDTGQHVVLAANFGTQNLKASVSVPLKPGRLSDALGGEGAHTASGKVLLELAPMRCAWFVRRDLP